MGNYNGTNVAYVASAASVGADLIVLSGAGQSVKVTNVAGTAPVFFTVSHPGGSCVVPTVGGANVYVVPSTAGGTTSVRHDGQAGYVVQAVSSGTTSYTVEVQSDHATS